MLELPNRRKEWNCGVYWENGERRVKEDGCEQLVYRSSTKKYLSGKFMVLNSVNGVGGKAHEMHKCPKWAAKVNLKRIEEKLRHKGCMDCLQEYDSIRCPLCPHCFKLECSKCGNLRTWINNERIFLKAKDIGNNMNSWTAHIDTSKPEIDNSVCPACGNIGMDVRQVWNAYQRLYGKYQF